ncbi:hypothetical protein EI94DRAFT_1760437, partial [Lactarius quietus]
MSPTRLHVHLLFTPRRSSRVNMLKNLPQFPILVDYSAATWTEGELGLATAAIAARHRNRVRGITFAYVGNILRAMGHPFPELENFKIVTRDRYYSELVLPATFLAPCLRRLTLQDVVPRSLSPLLSSATGLVELILDLRVFKNPLPEASLIANLQRMSCLRRLELRQNFSYYWTTISDSPGPPADSGDTIVPLSNLMQFIFVGTKRYLEALVVVLAAPRLQDLEVEIRGISDTFPIPHLCRFICDTDNQFILIRLHFSPSQVKFTGETCSPAQSFSIILPEPEFIIEWDYAELSRIEWRQIFEHIQQVKLIRVSSQVALDVAHAFQLDGQETATDLLPALEEVKVETIYYPPPISDSIIPYLTISDAFEPLIAARKKVGRPIMLSSTEKR